MNDVTVQRPFPIPIHATWDIIDSSKLTTYMQCPRKFFYRYLLGWTPTAPNNHLIFGSAWHMAMEHLLIERFSAQAIEEAKELFYVYYRSFFDERTDELFVPKTPLNALQSIMDYAQRFAHELREYEVLHTEMAGLVMVSEQRTMTFKCDAILRTAQGAPFGLDHKTSQRKYGNWGDHWTMSTQMLTYLHALHCLFPDRDDLSMLVRCAFFYVKSPTDFCDHPINKSLDQMTTWLARTNAWLDRLESDMAELPYCSDGDQVLDAFPPNDTACFNYGRQCAYFDFCNTWSNPLQRTDVVPIGFVQEFWDPLARPEIRERVDLVTPEEHNK